MTKKQQKIWDEKIKYVGTLTDKLGLHVDKGIRETVAIFHLFNINTTASHEGKMHRYPVPYIDVQAPGAGVLMTKFRKLKESAPEGKKILNQVLRKNLAERKKVIPLLEEFYANRKTPYEIRLGINSFPSGWSRVQSLGADFQDIEKSVKIRRQRLLQFQKEMHAFTEFLKGKYFNN